MGKEELMRLLGLLHVIDLLADSLEAEKKGDPAGYTAAAGRGPGKCETSFDSGCSLVFPVGL